MTARVIDGTAIAAEVRAETAHAVEEHIRRGGRQPKLTAVLVGDDPASQIYVRNKGRAVESVGMASDTVRLPAETTQAQLLELVQRLNEDPAVSGILVQFPVPDPIDERAVMYAIDPAKDVDGLTPTNLGRLLQGDPFLAGATPIGVMEMLARSGVDPAGKRVVIVGRSMLVGRPLAMLLANKAPGANATVTIAHTGTRDLGAVTREAEILIAAAGKARMITADMVRPGAVVIDVGTNRIDDPSRKSGSRLVGDVDYDAVAEVAGAISPVPGGVGPMTIAMVVANTLKAARALEGRE